MSPLSESRALTPGLFVGLFRLARWAQLLALLTLLVCDTYGNLHQQNARRPPRCIAFPTRRYLQLGIPGPSPTGTIRSEITTKIFCISMMRWQDQECFLKTDEFWSPLGWFPGDNKPIHFHIEGSAKEIEKLLKSCCGETDIWCDIYVFLLRNAIRAYYFQPKNNQNSSTDEGQRTKCKLPFRLITAKTILCGL